MKKLETDKFTLLYCKYSKILDKRNKMIPVSNYYRLNARTMKWTPSDVAKSCKILKQNIRIFK